MLGRLLEIAVSASPLLDSLEFYRSLGFQMLPAGDSPQGPNAVLWNGSVVLGLYAEELAGPVPTFVRPELKAHLRALRRFAVEFELIEVADEEFHRARFADPNGRHVLLVEARTFSPPPRDSAHICALGRFLELSVATHSAQESATFWEALGFTRVAGAQDPPAWVRLAGSGLTIGFYEAAGFGAALTFVADGLEARVEYLEALGRRPTPNAPVARDGRRAATLVAPEHTLIYLLEEGR